MFPPQPFGYNTLDKYEYLKKYDDNFCDPSITGLLFGFDREQCNKTLMEWASTSTSSVRAIIQFGQEIDSGTMVLKFKSILFSPQQKCKLRYSTKIFQCV